VADLPLDLQDIVPVFSQVGYPQDIVPQGQVIGPQDIVPVACSAQRPLQRERAVVDDLAVDGGDDDAS
jgi:hypothetical protein